MSANQMNMEKIIKNKKLLSLGLSFFLGVVVLFTTPSFVYASCSVHTVYNVEASPSLNVRSGPGTGYPVIASQGYAYDEIRYEAGNVSADGYQWMRAYYYQSGAGSYNGSYLGWVAWNYLTTNVFAYTGYSRPIYSDYNLSSISRNATAGSVAGNDCGGSLDSHTNNINAWVVYYTYDVPYVSGYINGYNWDGRHY